MTIHFLSGMPRSGTTLMSALLNQHPQLHVEFQSPVAQVCTRLVSEMSTKENEGGFFYTQESRLRTLRGIFSAFYADRCDHDKVIMDFSRRWCANMGLLDHMFPGSKVIACVRDAAGIMDSFERLFQKHPEEVSRIINRPNTTVYDRVQILLDNDSVVGYSMNAFRSAFFGLYQQNLLVVDYYDLALRPRAVLADIDAVLGLEPFEYDLENVQTPDGAVEADLQVGQPDLHTLRPKVSFEPRRSILPPDIIAALPPPFWKPDVKKNNPVKGVR